MQFMNDFATGVNFSDEMIPAVRSFIDCVRQSVLKRSGHKCRFGTTTVDDLGSTITPRGSSPESAIVERFLEQIQMPYFVEQVKRLIGYVHFFAVSFPVVDKNYYRSTDCFE